MTFAKKMMTATAALALTAGAAFADEMKNPMVGGAEMFADKNMVDTLAGEGPFTVFAPTNAGFDRLEPGTVEMLVKPENKERLTEILTCHVVGKAVMADALQGMIKDDGGEHPVPTLGGCTLQASYADDGRVILTDENGNTAFIEIADVKQSNGVIHVIDGVMLPKQ